MRKSLGQFEATHPHNWDIVSEAYNEQKFLQ